MKEIGEKLRQIRKLKGYSQEYMAHRMKISQRAYSKIENNETRIDWEKLSEISNILKIKPSDITNFDDNLVFHNCTQSGKFEQFINQLPEKMITQYEERIKHLEEEIAFLRKQLQN